MSTDMKTTAYAMGMGSLIPPSIDYFKELREIDAHTLTPETYIEVLRTVARSRVTLDAVSAIAILEKLETKLTFPVLDIIMNICKECIEYFSTAGNKMREVVNRNREHKKRSQWIRLQSHITAEITLRIKRKH